MKNKKILIILFFAIAIICLFSTKSNANLTLNNLEFETQINTDGSMDVTEKWDIHISETNTLFKTFKIDKSKYSAISNVSVVETTNGREREFLKINQEMYHVTEGCYYALINSSNMFEIAWGVELDDSSATRQYKISYTVEDAVALHNDYAELYWQFIGEDFEIDAKNITGVIKLPYQASSKEDIKVWGHTKYLNGEIYVTDLDTIKFTVNQYSNSNFVEIRALIPKDMISYSGRTYSNDILESVISEETSWANEANARRKRVENNKKIIEAIAIIVSVILLVIAYKNYRKLRNMKQKYKPTTELKYYRELPYESSTPAEALFVKSVGNTRFFLNSFSANILDLCLKKYLTLELKGKEKYQGNNIVIINLLDKDISSLKEDQQLTIKFLKEIAKDKNSIDTKEISKYVSKHPSILDKYDKKFQENIKLSEEKQENYDDKAYKESQSNIAIGVMCLLFGIFGLIMIASILQEKALLSACLFGIALISNAIISFVKYAKTNILTQKGIDEKEQWDGLERYMKDFSLLKEKDIPSLAVWEKFLVFATAFGISKKVINQLKVVYPEFNDADFITTYAYINIMSNVDIGSSINSSIMSAAASSGSGAGGGFSGGGGGGRRTAAVAEVARNKKYIKIKEHN